MALRNSRRMAAVGGALAVVLTAAACGSSDDGSGGGGGGEDVEASSIDCAPYEAFGDLEGTEVSVYTSIIAPEDGPHIASYRPFEECTGVTINYEGSREFEAQLPVRVQGGNAPDIAYLPQPGLLRTMVDTGQVVEAPPEVEANVDENMPDFKEYGTVDGTFYAAPLGANVKSFVWYSPTYFSEGGYEIPTTLDELKALSDQIVADYPDGSVTPWCAGIESGDATGWTATDWMEDFMLRTAGPEVYDQWVNHEIPFNDPQVAEALAAVGEYLKNDDYVNATFGDVRSIATTSFQDAGQPVVDGSCMMHRQASFYAANWPEGTNVAEDGDVWAFYLPAETADERPVLGAGEFTAAFADRPEVKAFQTYLSSVEWANERAKTCGTGGCVTANTNADPELLTNPIDKLSAEQLTDENVTFRFDASDLMPGAVGAGTFWRGMTDWIIGQGDQETLDFIENSWPTS
ncbi:carbohydrate ABC transporter substrate-binding protein [Phycicoccus sp. BSK3Z-2]|uniref:Carbohydrate ABC transporter substrate-binding protein n=1 Tax=Phycicoccus avicenniae TaxID=2828860 RepID=A0A941HZX8_9MICO|nr:ABC transporter substrate-binding protein [Phycicoccus avicenniae]MBR7743452.1 carbohydrate ABC transporter substrate-binding protein [Phycicoccus avicenniae]